MKRCARCLRWLALSEFSRNAAKRDGLQNNCRECQRAYVREHHVANRAYYLAKAMRSKKKFQVVMKEFIKELKAVSVR